MPQTLQLELQNGRSQKGKELLRQKMCGHFPIMSLRNRYRTRLSRVAGARKQREAMTKDLNSEVRVMQMEH
jgi:hypothetical protein